MKRRLFTKQYLLNVAYRAGDLRTMKRDFLSEYTSLSKPKYNLMGYVRACLPKLERPKTKPLITKLEAQEIISKYKTKKEFREQDNRLYKYLQKSRWLTELTHHLESSKSDYDVLYMAIFNDGLIKIGITSKRLGITRLKQFGKSLLVYRLKETPLAPDLEIEILHKYKKFQVIEDSVLYGKTEFLKLSPKDATEIAVDFFGEEIPNEE